MSFLKKLYLFYLLLLALTIIALNIFFRIFNSKESVSLHMIKELSIFHLTTICIFGLVHFFIIIIICYNIFLNSKKFKYESKVIIIANKMITKIYWEPLEFLHDIIAPHLPGSGKFLLFIAEILEKGNINLRYTFYHYSFLIFSYFPQLFASILFIFEILIYKKINLFFYVLPILLIPPLFQVYLKLCISFADRNLPKFHDILNIVGKDPDEFGNYKTWSFSFKPKYSSNGPLLLKKKVYEFELITKVKLHAEKIRKIKGLYDIYILLIISILFFFGTLIRLTYLI